MNDARVDHIEETLTEVSATVNAISERMPTLVTHEEFKAGFDKAFEQTQGGFEEFGRFAMFLDERLRKEMNERFDQVDKRFELVDRRFNQIDRRFDGMDERFDRLEGRFDRVEQLITGRPAPSKRRKPRT